MAGKPWTILNYSFRSFFLLNGLFAVVVMLLWILTLHGIGGWGLPDDPALWHAHEMLFGFAGSAVAGFLLTAVGAWTGRRPVQGSALGWLVAAWLAGRFAMSCAAVLPSELVALLDLAFPVLLCGLVGREIVVGRSRRNYGIVALTIALALLDLLYHLGRLAVVRGGDWAAISLAVHLLLVLVTLIAGRIVPSFTGNWLRARGATPLPAIRPSIERVVIPVTATVGLADALMPGTPLTGGLAITAALVHGMRLARWRGLATFKEPLLAVLHIAYLWLVIGYALLGMAAFEFVVPRTAALHALTAGGVGGMVLAVMSRVALGHTGRALQAARLTVIAYVLLGVAVVIRVGSSLLATRYLTLLDLSATGWIAAFALFTWVYWPILTQPRVDGRPERPPGS
ncbi:MAG: NnrS family protein [Candidatus Neomarinimicrobiota bacterium]